MATLKPALLSFITARLFKIISLFFLSLYLNYCYFEISTNEYHCSSCQSLNIIWLYLLSQSMENLNPTRNNNNNICISFQQNFTIVSYHRVLMVPTSSLLELICTTYCLHPKLTQTKRTVYTTSLFNSSVKMIMIFL